MGLAGFEGLLRGAKKLLLKQENLDSVLKSIFTWSPACILNFKMCMLKKGHHIQNIFEFLKSCISKRENGCMDIFTSPKKQKFQLPPNLSRGCTLWALL